jgi:tRNA uridine 5-carbamoylmethylation protein Kti12
MYAYILVGAPGSGKSTFKRHLMRIHPLKGWVAIGANEVLEWKAKDLRRTFDSVKAEFSDYAETESLALLKRSVTMQRAIIADSCNATRAERALILKEIPSTYRKTCVIINPPATDELRRRLDSRRGHTVADNQIAAFTEIFEYPNKDEGFDNLYEWPEKYNDDK